MRYAYVGGIKENELKGACKEGTLEFRDNLFRHRLSVQYTCILSCSKKIIRQQKQLQCFRWMVFVNRCDCFMVDPFVSRSLVLLLHPSSSSSSSSSSSLSFSLRSRLSTQLISTKDPVFFSSSFRHRAFMNTCWFWPTTFPFVLEQSCSLCSAI